MAMAEGVFESRCSQPSPPKFWQSKI